MNTATQETLKVILDAARTCAAEAVSQYDGRDDAPREWTGDMYDADIDYAGQMIGRPLDEYESNDFDVEFRRHFAAIMNSP